MIISITQNNYEKEILKSSKPVILYVFATWCGPCQMMEPIFEELDKELSDEFVFAKLNIDEGREIAMKLGVSSVPTFLFFQDGEIQNKEVGYLSKEDLQEKIMEIFG